MFTEFNCNTVYANSQPAIQETEPTIKQPKDFPATITKRKKKPFAFRLLWSHHTFPKTIVSSGRFFVLSDKRTAINIYNHTTTSAASVNHYKPWDAAKA